MYVNVQQMTVDQMLIIIRLSGILFYFFIPTLIAIAVISIYIKRKAHRNRIKQIRKQIKNLSIQEEMLPIMLPSRPSNIEKFRSLTIEFDEYGRAK